MNKKTIQIRLLILISILSFIGNTNAQVTIGTDEVATSGALLQLKEQVGVTDGSANSTKGLGMPRVGLTSKTNLYPMFDNDNDYATNSNNKKTKRIFSILGW